MILGARLGRPSKLRRLIAAAMARDLTTFIIPGPEVVRTYGLDVDAAGLKVVASPRHASVLLVAGITSPALRDAAAVIYAQMMRPRALFALGAGELSPLPTADVIAGLSQQGLIQGVRQLREEFAKGAFHPDVSDFDAPILHVRIEYTCPMHPEVVQNEPGSCPKCGMNLVPREVQADQHKVAPPADGPLGPRPDPSDHHGEKHHDMAHDAVVEYTCPMHPEVVQSEPGSCPKCGMYLEPRDMQTESLAGHHDHAHSHSQKHEHHTMAHDAVVEYTCPMHPEVVQSEPGSCPKCGMFLEPRDTKVESSHDHHDHMHSKEHEHQSMAHDAVVEYTCPMHPEVIQNEPGSCPKCGMNLEPRDTKVELPDDHRDHMHSKEHEHHNMAHDAMVEYTCPMHPEVIQNEPGSCPKCGMNLEPRDRQAESPTGQHDHADSQEHEHHTMAHDAVVEYTCPMHPEVIQNEPGSCPKCGMNLEPRETHGTQTHEHAGMDSATDHGSMDHSGMDHSEMSFMSMVDVTKDLPRSSDGLPMEWIDAPFGPFFPGLPGGLLLTLTLDGDTVAGSTARPLTNNLDLSQHPSTESTSFIEQLAGMDPLAPVAYRLLACRALENAAGLDVPAGTAAARIGTLERERITSHLGWLALFGQQTGFNWLMQHAASLQLAFLHADVAQAIALKPVLQTLIKRLQRTPLLKSRTAGIGRLAKDTALCGPVARAAGVNNDARSTETTCTTLGFTPVDREGGDALARLHVRLDEIIHSLVLIEAAGVIGLPALANIGDISGAGEAVVETPRGMARLQLTLERGQVIAAQLETPSTHHITLINSLTEQQSLGDALMAVGSLDLSPWEIRQ